MLQVAPLARHYWLQIQQDNTRAHIASCSYIMSIIPLTYQNINTLPWSTRSPGLALIEHVWDILGHNIKRRPRCAASGHRSPQNIRTIIGSMRYWRNACMLGDGGHASCFIFCDSKNDHTICIRYIESKWVKCIGYTHDNGRLTHLRAI